MPNLFATKPDLPPLSTPVQWTCPITGLTVPKDPDANLQYRAALLTAAESDPAMQQELYTACSQSILFWINAFAFTLRVFETGRGGKNVQAKDVHLPFVTWPIQDTLILKIENAIDVGEELLVDKSRDAGATWCHIVCLTHRLLFAPDESHLMISRKEDAVDVLDGLPKNYPFGAVADPGTLFGKIDYILGRLPEWMLPHMNRKKLHLVNLDSRTRIDGESSNASAGSSDRRKAIFLDEMAKMDEGESIKRSTRDVTACRLVCSTPNGPGTAFSKWRLSGQIPVFSLMWWDVPGKGDGRYVAQDQLGRWHIRSPWYDNECTIRDQKEIAIELDADHVGSGETFFDATIIEQHRKMFARPHKQRCLINFDRKYTDEVIAEQLRKAHHKGVRKIVSTDGGWRLWCGLIDNRPDQTQTYVLAVDISKGQGASNSVVSVGCNETRMKVAEFADAHTPPYELARIVCAAALFFGGRNKRPLIVWENNGDAGFDFGRQLVQIYHYPAIYFDRAVGTIREKVGKRYGWRSNSEKKAEALGLLRRCYAHGKFINPSGEALTECLSYVHYEGGGIGPAELVQESDSTRKAHGDRVIADMLLCWCLSGESGKIKAASSAPQRSFGHRLEAYKQSRKAAKDAFPARFDFATE